MNTANLVLSRDARMVKSPCDLLRESNVSINTGSLRFAKVSRVRTRRFLVPDCLSSFRKIELDPSINKLLEKETLFHSTHLGFLSNHSSDKS